MKERAVTFGTAGRLTGILTEPDPADARAGAPAVLTCNVGLNHHVGPYRFYVDLARALAKRGFASLRFDLSGLGDSAVRRDSTAEHERALEDLTCAMALVTERTGQQTFVPVGFCSSVDPAHRLAVLDPRVRGVCFIEGYAYRTPAYYLRYPLKYLSWQRWRRAASRKLPRPLRHLPGFRRLGRLSEAIQVQDAVFVRDYPDPAALRRDYEALSARGTRQLFVYTRGFAINHPSQFLDFTGLAALGPTREVVYLDEADHTLFRVCDREDTVQLICRWLERGTPK